MMAENPRFAAKLTEEEFSLLVENATPGATKKATKFGMKIFNGTYNKSVKNPSGLPAS